MINTLSAKQKLKIRFEVCCDIVPALFLWEKSPCQYLGENQLQPITKSHSSLASQHLSSVFGFLIFCSQLWLVVLHCRCERWVYASLKQTSLHIQPGNNRIHTSHLDVRFWCEFVNFSCGNKFDNSRRKDTKKFLVSVSSYRSACERSFSSCRCGCKLRKSNLKQNIK